MARLARPVTALLLALLTAGAVACGDDQPLEPDEYRGQADAICADTNAALDEIPDPVSAAEIVTTLDTARPIVDDQLDRLRGLTPPAALAERHDEVLDLLEEQREVIASLTGRIGDGEQAFDVVNELVPRLEEIDARADAAARAMGLEVCGQRDTP